MSKYRHFFIGCLVGASSLVSGGLIWRSQRPIPPTPPSPTEIAAARDPAASAPLPELQQELLACQRPYQAICGKRGVTRDPTGIVRPDIEGELIALRLYEEVIREHPDWTSEQVDEELALRIYTPKRKSRIESGFLWARARIEEFLNRQPTHVLTAQEKKLLKQRIREIELQLPPSASVYEDEPDLLTKNDVYYQRTHTGKLRLRVGGAYFFTSKSWFNLIFTMAHEIAHAIDPCELRAARISIPAYDRLSGCFLKQGLVATRKDRMECGDNDQLSEIFADWVAVQVTSEALKAYASEFPRNQILNAAINSVRDLCEPEDSLNESDQAYHPAPQVRIERIFGRHSGIRELLGCAPSSQFAKNYCSFESPLPPLRTTP